MSYPSDPRRLLEMVIRLEEKVADLEEQLPKYYPIDLVREKYGLSKKMAKLFSILKYDRAIEIDELCGLMGQDSREAVKMSLYNLRKKILRFGIGVINYRGSGYCLTQLEPSDTPAPLSNPSNKLFSLLSYTNHISAEKLMEFYGLKSRGTITNKIHSLREHTKSHGVTIDFILNKGYILRKMSEHEIKEFYRSPTKSARWNQPGEVAKS